MINEKFKYKNTYLKVVESNSLFSCKDCYFVKYYNNKPNCTRPIEDFEQYNLSCTSGIIFIQNIKEIRKLKIDKINEII